MIAFFCPYCKMPLKAEDAQADQLIACVQCKLEVRVPSATPPPQPATASAQPLNRSSSGKSSWWRWLSLRP